MQHDWRYLFYSIFTSSFLKMWHLLYILLGVAKKQRCNQMMINKSINVSSSPTYNKSYLSEVHEPLEAEN